MRGEGRTRRQAVPGFTLAEVLVSLLLGYLLVGLALGTLARQRAVVHTLSGRAERLAAARLARHVLGSEARAAAGAGAFAAGSDSLALRAFRGYALRCPGELGRRVIAVSAAGVRAPDPAKDSVLLMLASGGTAAFALVAREGSVGPCLGEGRPSERWTLSGPVPPGVVAARYFERGVYHLSGGALRYRRGLAGRQPLTPEVLAHPGSAFIPEPSGVRVHLLVGPLPTNDAAWTFRMPGAPGG